MKGSSLDQLRGSVGVDGREIVVSVFSPLHDGIAKYADQLAAALSERQRVLTLGLPGSNADRILRLDGGLRPLRLLRTTRRDDHLWVMWHPQYFVSGRRYSRALAYLALGFVLRRRNTTVVLQVPDAAQHGRTEEAARRWCWLADAELLFHTEAERAHFAQRFGPLRRPALITHGAFYRPYAHATRTEARRRLGIESDEPVFVCLGFIGEHKGFDRAIHAFSTLQESARLYVVGSTLYDNEHERRHLADLRRLAADVPGVEIREQWLEDDAFDLWLLAADALLAPYRHAASSGVVARARLVGTKVVAAATGGLPEQLGSTDELVRDDAELEATLHRITEACSAERSVSP